jgi:hypothetical protein
MTLRKTQSPKERNFEFFMIAAIIFFVYGFTHKNFTPESNKTTIALFISALVTFVVVVWLAKDTSPLNSRRDQSAWRKGGYFLAISIVTFFLVLCGVLYGFGAIHTDNWGVSSEQEFVVQQKTQRTAHKGCKNFLDLSNKDTRRQVCVTRDVWDRAEVGEKVKVKIRTGSWGTHWHDFEVLR